MPRIGSNPMKRLDRDFSPSPVSVCTLVYIPELKGYWAQSLEVLKVCLSSLILNTREKFDLVVLDNGSCEEVREFLLDLSKQGIIQILLLSHSNMGKPGGWNTLLPACPGDYIAFTDSDVLFRPGWLTRSLEIFETFERVGMVTARPFRTVRIRKDELMSATLSAVAADDSIKVERGDLVGRDVLAEHWDSLGASRDKVMAALDDSDVRLTKGNVKAYAYASHFQFLTRRDTALQVLPLDGTAALAGGEKDWDRRINDLGMLRLSTDAPLVRHLGNTIADEELATLATEYSLTGAVRRRMSEQSGNTDRGLLTNSLRRVATIPRCRRMMERTYSALFAALQAPK